MAKAKGKSSKAKKGASSKNNPEARQTAQQLKDLKKNFKSEFNRLKNEFKNKMKAIAATSYQKALADFGREVEKRVQAKTKLLRETAANFDKSFQSKFASVAPVKTAKPAKKAKKKSASKKRSRPAKKA